MAVTAERHYGALGVLDRVSGLTTAPYGYAGHAGGRRRVIHDRLRRATPTPDAASVRAAEARSGTRAADAPSAILSSCCCPAAPRRCGPCPAAGLDLAAKTALTRGLLKSGADIHEMNTVRRHISRIKGGRLSKATSAPMLTLAISDVPGDDPATIGSGPTVPDPTTLADARAVLAAPPPAMRALGLDDPAASRCSACRSAPTRRPSPTIRPSPRARVPHHRHARRRACRRRARWQERTATR